MRLTSSCVGVGFGLNKAGSRVLGANSFASPNDTRRRRGPILLLDDTYTSIPSSGETWSALAGGSRIDIKHKYYIALHINLLVIYII